MHTSTILATALLSASCALGSPVLDVRHNGGGYPSGGYPPSGSGGYPPSGSGGYPPSGSGYPPSGGNPPSGGSGGYPPSGGSNPPSGGGSPPSSGGGWGSCPSGSQYTCTTRGLLNMLTCSSVASGNDISLSLLNLLPLHRRDVLLAARWGAAPANTCCTTNGLLNLFTCSELLSGNTVTVSLGDVSGL